MSRMWLPLTVLVTILLVGCNYNTAEDKTLEANNVQRVQFVDTTQFDQPITVEGTDLASVVAEGYEVQVLCECTEPNDSYLQYADDVFVCTKCSRGE